MKNMNKMKRFGAAVTAAMMLGSLNAAVFADEDVTEEIPEAPAVTEPAPVEEPVIEAPVLEDETTEAPAEEVTEPAEEETPAVEEEAPAAEEEAEGEVALAAEGDGDVLVDGSTNDSEITITGAKASLKDGIYTVTVQYAFSGVTPVEKSQIAMLGYIFDTTAESASDVTVFDGNIRAVDQDVATKGQFKFNLAQGDGSNMTVSDKAKMVIKLGANVDGVSKAQAFFIDLSLASEGGEEVVYGDFNGDGKTNANDLNIFARYIAEWDGYTLETYPGISTNGDLNVDGKVNITDYNIFARHVAEWEGYETLPIPAD